MLGKSGQVEQIQLKNLTDLSQEFFEFFTYGVEN